VGGNVARIEVLGYVYKSFAGNLQEEKLHGRLRCR